MGGALGRAELPGDAPPLPERVAVPLPGDRTDCVPYRAEARHHVREGDNVRRGIRTSYRIPQAPWRARREHAARRAHARWLSAAVRHAVAQWSAGMMDDLFCENALRRCSC